MAESEADEILVQRIGQGDLQAYRVLVARYLGFCVRFAERMLGNRSDAEDVAQIVSLKIWNEASGWTPRAKFSTWLYRVVFNACIDYRRRVVSFSPVEETEIEDQTLTPEEAVIKDDVAARVRLALGRLPDRQRAAVVLSYYEGLKNQDAAHSMGLDLGAFQQLLFRARKNLKEDLEVFGSEGKDGTRS